MLLQAPLFLVSLMMADWVWLRLGVGPTLTIWAGNFFTPSPSPPTKVLRQGQEQAGSLSFFLAKSKILEQQQNLRQNNNPHTRNFEREPV